MGREHYIYILNLSRKKNMMYFKKWKVMHLFLLNCECKLPQANINLQDHNFRFDFLWKFNLHDFDQMPWALTFVTS